MELIQRKDRGPLTALRNTYRKQMTAMMLVPILLISVNMQDMGKTLTSVLFWCYVLFCAFTVLFARYNYYIVKSMQAMDEVVKTNLAKQISLLEKRANLEITYLRCALIFFAVLIEVLPYFQHYRMLDKWHSLPFFVRIGGYAGLFLLQYLLNTRLKERRVGQHLIYLKELVSEMQ